MSFAIPIDHLRIGSVRASRKALSVTSGAKKRNRFDPKFIIDNIYDARRK